MKVRCLVCGETLRYTEDNTGVLIEHLNEKHSGTEVLQHLVGSQSKKDKAYLSSFTCTYCCKTGKPLLKKNGGGQDKGWFTMFGCWPFCCRSDGSQVLSIYCSSCGKYGGSFDRSSGKLTLEKQKHEGRGDGRGDH